MPKNHLEDTKANLKVQELLKWKREPLLSPSSSPQGIKIHTDPKRLQIADEMHEI